MTVSASIDVSLSPAPTDVGTAMLGRLPEQFRDRPNIERFLRVFGTEMQSLVGALNQLLTQRTVDTAVGVQMDQIGLIVGEPRNGLTDDAYRPYLRGRIATNRSEGTTEDIIGVLRLVINDPTYTISVVREGVATLRVLITGATTTDAFAGTLFAFLQDAISAGVRGILEWYAVTPVFTYDVGPGFDQGHLASSEG